MSITAAASRTLDAWLSRCEGAEGWQLVDRASGLLMLRSHAPAFFESHALGDALDEAGFRLIEIPASTPSGIDIDTLMTRVDGVYFRSLLGLGGDLPDLVSLTRRLNELRGTLAEAAVWTMAEMLGQVGWGGLIDWQPTRQRASTPQERRIDLYFLTHVVLLETRFLTVDARRAVTSSMQEIAAAVPWAIREGLSDLVGELAICLQAGGLAGEEIHGEAISHLLGVQRPSGEIIEVPRRLPAMPGGARAWAHTTEVALLALAGASDRLA